MTCLRCDEPNGIISIPPNHGLRGHRLKIDSAFELKCGSFALEWLIFQDKDNAKVRRMEIDLEAKQVVYYYLRCKKLWPCLLGWKLKESTWCGLIVLTCPSMVIRSSNTQIVEFNKHSAIIVNIKKCCAIIARSNWILRQRLPLKVYTINTVSYINLNNTKKPQVLFWHLQPQYSYHINTIFIAWIIITIDWSCPFIFNAWPRRSKICIDTVALV